MTPTGNWAAARKLQREEVGDALRRSLDLADLAERYRIAAVAIFSAAADIDRAHFIPDMPTPWAALEAGKAAACDVFAAADEYTGNAALARARGDQPDSDPPVSSTFEA